jgi:hypothetical protein
MEDNIPRRSDTWKTHSSTDIFIDCLHSLINGFKLNHVVVYLQKKKKNILVIDDKQSAEWIDDEQSAEWLQH